MHSEQERHLLAQRLEASGLKDKALMPILGVSQSTVSRLRHAKIGRVRRYLLALDVIQAPDGVAGETLNRSMAELAAQAESDLELRRVLFGLHKLMQRG